MTDSLRLATIRKGLDPRSFAMVAAGGAGPLHAAALARDLDSACGRAAQRFRVLRAKRNAAVRLCPLFVRTVFGRQGVPVAAELEGTLLDLERTAAAEFSGEGVDPGTLSFSRSADVRYVGQVHEINVPLVGEVLDDGGYARNCCSGFMRCIASASVTRSRVIRSNLLTSACWPEGRPHPSPTALATIEGKAAPLRHRRAWFAGSWAGRARVCRSDHALGDDTRRTGARGAADQHDRRTRRFLAHPLAGR